LSSRTSCALHTRLFDFLTTLRSRSLPPLPTPSRSRGRGRRRGIDTSNSNRHLSSKSSGFCLPSGSF
jgi:hypothetical protein